MDQPAGSGQPDADLSPESPADSRARGKLADIAYALGALGLLGATAADALAVAGRHTGLHLLGSIELVQAMMIVLGAAAMLIATLTGNHASVHIVTGRLSPPLRARLARLAALAGAAVFLILAAGSAWVARDLWSGFEQTELLHIPLRWLRLLWIGFALLIALRFARNALGKPA
ncbi:MAG: TRAP transporter small permease [Sphingomonadales bacterium]|nr:TRAP transporter small permease [Sphingomonadales bacterium]